MKFTIIKNDFERVSFGLSQEREREIERGREGENVRIKVHIKPMRKHVFENVILCTAHHRLINMYG